MKRKPIFDTVRKLLGRGFTKAETALIDAAIDRALRETDYTISSSPTRIGPAGTALIKQFEGCRLTAYPDPGTGGDPWTIGWGATHMNGRNVRPGDVITQARADALLDDHLATYAAEVARAIGNAETTQAQFDALVSFHYNTGAIGRATLTKKHCAGDVSGAAAEFGKWTRAGGRALKGLVRRREAEAKLYKTP